MSDRNDVARPYKDVRLRKLDMLRLTGQMCRAKHDKERIPVLLQLRSLVPAKDILDCQVMETKFLLNLAQQLLIGFEQAQSLIS